MNLSELSDKDLNALIDQVLIERDRRLVLDSLPGQIAEMKTRFLDLGGDPSKLVDPEPVLVTEPQEDVSPED